MRSPTIFFLLSALIGLSSGTIYWRNAHGKVDREELKAKVQTQVNLVIHAFEHQDIPLLYSLIPFGYDIDRYLKSHPNQVVSVQVLDVDSQYKGVKAWIKFRLAGQFGQFQDFYGKLDLIKSNDSPTGYIISKGFVCDGFCHLGSPPY